MILNIISLIRDIAWKLQADTFWQILNKGAKVKYNHAILLIKHL